MDFSVKSTIYWSQNVPRETYASISTRSHTGSSSDILLIENQAWYRVLGQLRQSHHTTDSLTLPDNTTHMEQKSSTHIRCLPSDSVGQPNYPAEVTQVINAERGLIVLSGPKIAAKPHCIALVESCEKSQYPPINRTSSSPTETLLLSTDQADIKVLSILVATDALSALRDSISQVVIAIIDGRNNADALRYISLILNHLPNREIKEMLSEQIVSLVNVNLVRTVQNRYQPLVAVTNRNESIASLISEGHFQKLENAVQRGNGGYGSISADIQLAEWLQQHQISLEEALRFAMYPATMRLRASGIIHND